MSQFRTALRVLRNDGVGEAVKLTRRNLARWYRTESEASGASVVRLDGCRFILDHPLIPPDNRVDLLDNLHEQPERQLCSRFLDRSLPVIDLGANMGIVSCIVNRTLKDPHRHVCVEANPHLIPLLEDNRRRNRCHFEIVAAAVAYGCETVELSLSENLLGSRVAGESETRVLVPTTTVGAVCERTGMEWGTLVMDVEGMEVDVIANEIDLLRQRFATMIVEFHEHMRGVEVTANAIGALRDAGFKEIGKSLNTLVLRNSSQRA